MCVDSCHELLDLVILNSTSRTIGYLQLWALFTDKQINRAFGLNCLEVPDGLRKESAKSAKQNQG